MNEKPQTTTSTGLDAARTAQAELRQKLQDAIRELSPRLEALNERKRKLSDELAQLILWPLPASEYGALIQEWAGRLAKRGEEKVHKHLAGHVARAKMRHGDTNMPMPFVIAEMLMTGVDHGKGTHVSDSSCELPSLPVPVDDSGKVDFEVLCFLTGDLAAQSLRNLLERRPISYGHAGGVQLGEGIEKRRAAIMATKRDLSLIEDELAIVSTELNQLRQSVRVMA